jgi:hypothetical protein
LIEGKAIQDEVGAVLKTPTTIPYAFLLKSGQLKTGPKEIAIIQPLVRPEIIKGKLLQTRKVGETSYKSTELGPGLNIISANVAYIWPDEIPFTPLFANIA